MFQDYKGSVADYFVGNHALRISKLTEQHPSSSGNFWCIKWYHKYGRLGLSHSHEDPPASSKPAVTGYGSHAKSSMWQHPTTQCWYGHHGAGPNVGTDEATAVDVSEELFSNGS